LCVGGCVGVGVYIDMRIHIQTQEIVS
jgi:hypothetical protein